MSRFVFRHTQVASVIVIMTNRRIQRVSELVKQQISEVLLELNLTGCGLVTVTSAEVSPDLKDGRGYVSVSQGRVYPDSAYNVVVYYPSVGYIYSLAHELGHNFGCLHERGNNGGDDTVGALREFVVAQHPRVGAPLVDLLRRQLLDPHCEEG